MTDHVREHCRRVLTEICMTEVRIVAIGDTPEANALRRVVAAARSELAHLLEPKDDTKTAV